MTLFTRRPPWQWLNTEPSGSPIHPDAPPRWSHPMAWVAIRPIPTREALRDNGACYCTLCSELTPCSAYLHNRNAREATRSVENTWWVGHSGLSDLEVWLIDEWLDMLEAEFDIHHPWLPASVKVQVLAEDAPL